MASDDAPATPEPPPLTACADQCGATVPDDQIEASGWEYLSIQRRYRCTSCWRALRQAAGMHGTYEQGFVDTLPATSRGALRKETASTILAPMVKA